MLDNKPKSLLVCSGGVDSTAVLINAYSMDDHFDVLYVWLEPNKNQQKRELKQLRKIMKRLDDIYVRNKHKHNLYVVKYVGAVGNIQTSYFQQIAYSIVPALFKYIDEYHEVVYGYIRNDDYWHDRVSFETLFKTVLATHYRERKAPTMSYPFEWTDKSQIVKYHYRDFPEILQMTYVCEDPGYCLGTNPEAKHYCKKCKDKKTAIEQAKNKAVK